MMKGLLFLLPAIFATSALVFFGCSGGASTSPFDQDGYGLNQPAPSPTDAAKTVVDKEDISLSPSPTTNTNTYNWMAGAGELCASNGKACPVVSQAQNGDQITFTGGGTLSLTSGEFTGGGTIDHTDAQGALLNTASWSVIQLLNFHSYGPINGGPFPEGSSGGRLMARVHVLTDDGTERNGVLWITCARGENVPAGMQDGVQLNIPGIGNFNEEVSGGTAFVLR